jgi:hypothetical protein
MKLAYLAVTAAVLAGCQSAPPKPNGTNTVERIKIESQIYQEGMHRYPVDANLLKPKLSIAQQELAKREAEKERNRKRNSAMAEDVQQASKFYTENDGWFTWITDQKQFTAAPNLKSKPMRLLMADGREQIVKGRLGNREIEARAKVIHFGVLTDRSVMLIIAPITKTPGSETSISIFNEAVAECGTALPYAFGDIHFISRTTNPAVAAKQACIVEKTEHDSFLKVFYNNALSIEQQVEGAELVLGLSS